jgi:hypothetical protein
VLGEEDVACHAVRIEDGRILVGIRDPSPEQERSRLLPSLRRGVDDRYNGQIARDVVRLLRAEADPAELVWEGVAWGAPRAEFGWGHALASATDCLTLVGLYGGDERAHAVVQALAGIAEVEHRRPVRPQPAPVEQLPADPGRAFRTAIEAQDGDTAEALVLGALAAGTPADELLPWFLGIVADHHLSFGHQAIYTQKAYELVAHLGVDRAATVLPHLVPAAVTATREDTLPYLRPAVREMAAVDYDELAGAADRRRTGWVDEDGALRAALLAPGATPISAATRAVRDGAGIEGLLDTVVLAASERLLRHDPELDFDPRQNFTWLDITHSLTYAHAARWAWRARPGPDTAKLALWTVFHVHDSGRAEWRRTEPPRSRALEPVPGDLRAAIDERRPDVAVSAALASDPEAAGDDLARAALTDRAGSFIVAAHLVKTSEAARREGRGLDDPLPIAAAARFLASPRLERFVTASVTEAIDFLRTGSPPRR